MSEPAGYVDLTVRVRVPRTLSRKHVRAALNRADPDIMEVEIDEQPPGGEPPERDEQDPYGPGGLLAGGGGD